MRAIYKATDRVETAPAEALRKGLTEKRRRQFIFATHNANIPVLGDAELIIGMSAKSESGAEQAALSAKYMGAIDARGVRELVEEVLEGGRRAFELRRKKYGF